MEMTSGGANNYRRVPDDELGDPAAAAEPCPPAAAREKDTHRRRLLLVAGLMTLPLLAFFVLGRESASTVWDFASAKLLNNGFFNTASPHHGTNPAAGADELLGGLLAPGMDRRSCQSRHELWRYFKHFPYAPSPYLLSKLRAYEARHRRCAPGTPLYADAISRLRSGISGGAAAAGEDEECRYIIWLPFDGLGNRMLSMVSGFLYALLTGRVFLAAVPPDAAGLFCEPFPNTTWLLPVEDFPVANLFRLGPRHEQSLTRLLAKNKITVPDAGDAPEASNATAAPPVPAYVYLSLGWRRVDMRPFFCGENQRALAKVSWLLLYSDVYFAPSLYKIGGGGGFHDELRRMFPETEATAHLLLRYLLHPGNAVWGLATRYYHAYLAPASRRIGVQIRMSVDGDDHVPADDKYNQILACSRQENNILPETAADGNLTAAGDNGMGGNTTAILVASLFAEYYDKLRSRYYENATAATASGTATWVGVFQPTHEEVQATGKLEHNRKALAEIYLLSFSEELVTSGLSTFGYVAAGLAGVRPAILLTTFGHKVPEPPCLRAVSMEPCNLTPPPADVTCRDKAVDEEDIAQHVKVCEDWTKGVKLYD